MNRVFQYARGCKRRGKLTSRARFFHYYSSIKARGRGVTSSPVFVLGNQKSGTSVIAAAFSASIGASLQNDFFYFPANDLAALLSGRKNVEWMVNKYRYAFQRGVIKEPGLTIIAPQLHEFFPESKFVCVIRDPIDNIRSIVGRLNGVILPDGAIIYDGFECTQEWRQVVDGSLNLPENKGMSVETLCHRWRTCVERMLMLPACARQFIKYETFRLEGMGATQKVASQLGFGLSDTPRINLEKKYQPSSSGKVDISSIETGVVEETVSRVCGPIMSQFGYV